MTKAVGGTSPDDEMKVDTILGSVTMAAEQAALNGVPNAHIKARRHRAGYQRTADRRFVSLEANQVMGEAMCDGMRVETRP
ncbi:hypothetical protein ACWGE0_05245 [Lentzea sp. NPDC054927]